MYTYEEEDSVGRVWLMKICNKWLLHRSSYYILQYGNAGNINQGLKQPQSFLHTNTHGRSYAHMHKSLHWILNHTKDGDERVAICLKGYLIVSPYFQRIQSFSSFPSPLSLSLSLPPEINKFENERNDFKLGWLRKYNMVQWLTVSRWKCGTFFETNAIFHLIAFN